MDTTWTPHGRGRQSKELAFPESLIEKHFEIAEPLAQSVEHRPFKPRVAGSIPARLTSPHRLVVRTPLFQGGNGGSIPPEGTTYLSVPLMGAKLTGLKAGLAQRKSACLTSKRSLVQVQHSAPVAQSISS